MNILIKRAYENPEESDGYRILVDHLWPRGLSKEKAKVDFWAKEIAPSNRLRQKFHHDANRWEEFYQEYQKELEKAQKAGSESFEELLRIISEKPVVTLVYGAKDTEHNNAVVLRDFLQTVISK